MTAPETEYRYPLSPLQKGMLFHTLLAPRSGVYVQQLVGTLHEELDGPAFQQAWQWVIDRHPVLRTSVGFADSGELVQRVQTTSASFEEHDWRRTEAGERDERLRLYLDADRRRGFELGATPLMRLALFRMEPADYRFVWTSHHVLLDGRSRLRVLEELFSVYDAFRRGDDAPRFERARPYRDYVEWLGANDMTEAERFWRRELGDFTAPTPLVVDTDPGSAAPDEGFGTRGVRLSEHSTAALERLARQHGLTLNTFVQGAWALLLSRYSGESDVVFGATRACRMPETSPGEAWVGLFINTLPVRVRVSFDEPLIPWLRQLRARWRAARDHEHAPLVDVQGWSEVPAGNPLFQSVVVFEHRTPQAALQEQGERWAGREFRLIGATNYPLTVSAWGGSELLLEIGFDRGRFEEATIDRMLGHLRTLLEGIAADPERCVSELPLLTEAERRQVLIEWNDTRVDYPRDLCVHELFVEQVGRTPEAVAVAFEDQCLTYRELNRRANLLAHTLRELGVGPDVPVGVCLERSPQMIVALLGVLKAGGAYVPLDPTYPAARLKFMLEDTAAPVLLTQEVTRRTLPAHAAHTLCLDADSARIERASAENPRSNGATAEALAYVIYTSGSTGQPKGVCVPHRAVGRLVMNADYVSLTSADVVAQASNATFDAATWEIWGTLLNGARLVILPWDAVLSPRALSEEIERHEISTLFLTTALFNQVARENPAAFRPLRQLLFGGEAVEPRWVRDVLTRGAPERLLHVYGPTETTTYATWHLVQAVEDGVITIPIGRPIANTEAYVLDTRLQPVPVGVPGELYIGGPGVARGYLNRPELTGEKFILHPFRDERGARLYKTGDLVRREANGDIRYLRRLDHQVKIRGFRVELGEVESVLNGHAAIRESVVIEDAPEQKRLVAYIVPAGAAPSQGELRAFLHRRLPDFMVPSTFVVLDGLPLTSSGKVDRRALPTPERARPDPGTDPAAPRDALEERLAGIWKEVLGVPVVGVDDDFFELGGHSLLAVSLFARIEKTFGRRLPLASLFRAPTVRQVADVLRMESEEAPWESVVAIQPLGSRPPFFCVHGGGGHVFIFRALAQHLGEDQPFYGIQVQEPDRVQTASLNIEDMAAAYIRELREVQPEGPYFLGGFSFGGVVAFEMAQQLRAQGQEVALLVLLDTKRPNYLKASFRARLHFQAYTLRRRGPLRYLRRLWRYFRKTAWRVALETSLRSGFPPPHVFPSERLLKHKASRAVNRYEAQPYPGRITLFRGAGSKANWMYPDEPRLGWDSVAVGGVEVHEMPGNHGTFFKHPHLAKATAVRLKACLEQAQRSSP